MKLNWVYLWPFFIVLFDIGLGSLVTFLVTLLAPVSFFHSSVLHTSLVFRFFVCIHFLLLSVYFVFFRLSSTLGDGILLFSMICSHPIYYALFC